MANFKKGSAAAKAFMAKLRAARGKTKVVKAKAKAKKVVAKKTATKKVGNSYYGSGKIISAYNLKINTIYEWILGAEYLEVIYIGLTTKNKKIRAGSKMGIGGYLFKFVKDNTFVDLSYKAVTEAIRTIPKKVGAARKSMPAKKATSMHKDTKSHNVNIRVVSGIAKSKETQFYEIIKDNNLIQYFNTYGKTYAKFNANVKTNIATGKKSISPLAIEFYKKIENLPLKFTAKPIGKKTKHFEYIDGKNQDTYHQLTEYKVTI